MTMTNQQIELAKWWTSLRISDKENLAKQQYPQCTVWWNGLSETEQIQVKEAAGIVRGPRNKSQGFT